ncbi:hypothetical protein pdam_00008254, partial [Pocillopora damicornis]
MGDIIVDTFHYEAHSLSNEAFEVLVQFFREKKLCDVIIQAGERKVKCHRVVLSSCSPYFRGMFTNDMIESSKDTVVIQGLSEEAVIQLINFIYTRKITISIDNIEALLTAAAVFQLDLVVHACCEFMKRHLHPSNCLEMRAYAELHGCRDFIEAADAYSRSCFLSLMNTEALLKTSFRHFLAIISGEDLYVKREEQVFEAISAWVRFDLVSREQFLSDLLSHVRLPLIATDYLIQRVERDMIIRNNVACRDLIDEAKNVKLYPSLVKVNIRAQPRKSTSGALFSIGGRGKSGDPLQCIECYDWFHNCWFQVAEVSTPRRHVAVASVAGKVYAIGGHDGSQHLNTVECFNPEINQWKIVASMEISRRGMSAGVLEGVIYVAGGLDETTCFDAVERYDPENDTWSMVAPMLMPRGGVGVAGLGGYLYAVGGNDGAASLQSVERYNPHTNKWSRVASMNRRRAGVGVAVVGEFLYAIGGFDDSSPLDSVEKYDPRTNQWTYVASMTTCRGGVGAGAMGGRLWAVGGHNGEQYLNSVESYNPLADLWEEGAPMHVFRAGSGVVGSFCDVEVL